MILKDQDSKIINEVIAMWHDNKSARQIAEAFDSDHHQVVKLLKKNGVTVTKNRTTTDILNKVNKADKVLIKNLWDQGHSVSQIKYKTGVSDWVVKKVLSLLKIPEKEKRRKCTFHKKCSELVNRKNMATHLLGGITINDLEKYTDFNRLKFLNHVLARNRKHFPTRENYLAYLDKFYFDKNFNNLYDKWIQSNCNKWFLPSIDHIEPKSTGGTFDLDNLRFISWFENRAKAEMNLNQ